MGRTPLEEILASGRGEFELRGRTSLAGPPAIDRADRGGRAVHVIDAHPPREVVPAYRDVSAAISDVELLNEALAYAAERRWSGKAERRPAATTRRRKPLPSVRKRPAISRHSSRPSRRVRLNRN